MASLATAVTVAVALAATADPPGGIRAGRAFAATATRRDGPDIVEVVIAAQKNGQATALRDNLLELFGRIEAIAWYRDTRRIDPEQLRGTAGPVPAALAYVWIDIGVAHPDRALVYLSGADQQRILQRTVLMPAGFDEVAREEIAQIVASSVDTLRAGAPLRVAKPDDVLLTAPPRAPRGWLALGATGAAERWSDEQAAVPAFGLSAMLARRRGAREGDRFEPALWLTLDYHGATTSGPVIALAMRGGSAALVALPGWRLGRGVGVRAGAGVGLELLSVTPSLGDAQSVVLLDPPRWVTTPFARAALRLDVDLTGPFCAFVAATGDVNLRNNSYFVDNEGASQPVYTPSRFRPAALVGVEARIMIGAAP